MNTRSQVFRITGRSMVALVGLPMTVVSGGISPGDGVVTASREEIPVGTEAVMMVPALPER